MAVEETGDRCFRKAKRKSVICRRDKDAVVGGTRIVLAAWCWCWYGRKTEAWAAATRTAVRITETDFMVLFATANSRIQIASNYNDMVATDGWMMDDESKSTDV
jgi:hypothetical protein